MRVVRSLIFALVFYAATSFFVLAAIAAAYLNARLLRAVVRGWCRFHRVCARLILGQQVRVIGDMPDMPALYIFKHESMFETLDLPVFFEYPMIGAKTELAQIPLWGWAARRYGIMEVRRGAGGQAIREMSRDARRAKAQGRPVCLFAEGTRVPHGERPPLRAGFAALYKLLDMPVIPVAVDSGRVAPRNGFVKSPGTITYLVGDTIPPGLPREEAEARVHAAINALNPPKAVD